MSSTIGNLSTTIAQLCMRLDTVEKMQVQYHQAIKAICLKMEDEENCSRRNNITLRDFSEAVFGLDLYVTVTAILNKIMPRTKDRPIELDRVHRVAGHANRSCDVLCKIY